jgi:hypothetical protein
MYRLLVFPLIVLFWVTMNILLWRAEYGARMPGGSPVPVETVWNRILTAPDDSALAIFHEDRKIGYCRWTPQIHELLGEDPGGDGGIEGMVRSAVGYSIRLEGNVLHEGTRIRFNLDQAFSPDHRWNSFSLRLSLPGAGYRIDGDAGGERLTVGVDLGGHGWERQLTFGELRDPAALLSEFGVPFPLAMITQGLGLNSSASFNLGLNWESKSDWIKIGGTNVRIFRLEARLLDKYEFRVYISRVGEILRVELPNDLVLVNEGLFP